MSCSSMMKRYKMTDEELALHIKKTEWLLDMYQHLAKGGEIELYDSEAAIYTHTYKKDDNFILTLTMKSNPEMWHKKPLIETREISYPTAEVKQPEDGTICFIPSLSEDGLFSAFVWASLDSNKDDLRKNLIHWNEEDAIAHTKALLGNDIKAQNE